MDDREELLLKIQIIEFNMYDAALYLDTHPCDEAALDFFHHFRELKDRAVDEYAACYGPLTMDTVESKTNWTWIDHPWPWEMEA
jgi:spore coat protein JB